MSNLALVVPEHFIQATRDSGYKSLGSAVAELVDNSFEASASNVAITVERLTYNGGTDVRVRVADDGIGIDSRALRHVLRFGWSSRFNQRVSHGRYGMGLPNASLSQARRVDIASSVDGKRAMCTHLDVDEVIDQSTSAIAPPVSALWSEVSGTIGCGSGTVVTWTQCDRLRDRKIGPLVKRLRVELGRLFRYHLWSNKRVTVNGENVSPFDPLYLRLGTNLTGATQFGPELDYEVKFELPDAQNTSRIVVSFSELPICEWHSFSNKEKNARGIAKNAGVSIVRAGREIDRGWFFMGSKRKENYDDWWRCEVRFSPELDEWFGVTHTKQEVHPTERLLKFLEPEIEPIARELNARARKAFMRIRDEASRRHSETLAETFDSLIEPPTSSTLCDAGQSAPSISAGRGRVRGLQYRLQFQPLKNEALYQPHLEGTTLIVTVNELHPLVRHVWLRDPRHGSDLFTARRCVELLILAAARSESMFAIHDGARSDIENFRRTWSSILATFLS